MATINQEPATQTINDLCEFVKPNEWKDWLNEIQAALLRSGELAGYTKEAFSEFGDNFLYLQRFFSALQTEGAGQSNH